MAGDQQTFVWLVRVAGALSFCQLPAMAAAPRLLRWSDDLASLTPLSRRIVGVIGVAIMLIVQGTGAVTLVGAGEIAGGSRLGTAFAALMGIFWSYRAGAQRVYAPLWPPTRIGRLSHWGLLGLFSTQATIFLAAFVRGLVVR